MDSTTEFIADVPSHYRGLRLLRTLKSPKVPTAHFEVSAESALFVAVPRGGKPPTASNQLNFQPIKFASIDNGVSVYTAASQEVSSRRLPPWLWFGFML